MAVVGLLPRLFQWIFLILALMFTAAALVHSFVGILVVTPPAGARSGAGANQCEGPADDPSLAWASIPIFWSPLFKGT